MTSTAASPANPVSAYAPPASTPAAALAPLRDFVTAFGRLLDGAPGEARVLREGGDLLARLVAHDTWLPAAQAEPHPQHYQQHLLHVDSTERFSVVSFVWGPGQQTPVHDHTVWGLIGMLRGSEFSQGFRIGEGGRPVPEGAAVRLQPGQVEAVSPAVGDMHQVRNAHGDRVSIGIHVYGANIGAVRRHVYPADGPPKPFVSGYSAVPLPNFWDRSREAAA